MREVPDAPPVLLADPGRDELDEVSSSAPTTPSAPYRAPVSAVAASTMRLRTLRRSRSEEIAMTASNRALAEPESVVSGSFGRRGRSQVDCAAPAHG